MQQVAGGSAAFTRLFDRHQARVVLFCQRFVGDAHRAEELAQDVFIKLFRSAGRYQRTARFQTFLFRQELRESRGSARRTARWWTTSSCCKTSRARTISSCCRSCRSSGESTRLDVRSRPAGEAGLVERRAAAGAVARAMSQRGSTCTRSHRAKPGSSSALLATASMVSVAST